MPTNTYIVAYTLTLLGDWSGKNPKNLRYEDTLETTLNFDSKDYLTCAMALRGYIKRFKENESIYTSELKASKVVGKVCETMVMKINEQTLTESEVRGIIQELVG